MSTHPTARTPRELRPHTEDYFPESWRGYSLQELGSFVSLLVTRSLHRGNPKKRAKDLYDARNYWRMLGAHLDAHELDAESQTFDFGGGSSVDKASNMTPYPEGVSDTVVAAALDILDHGSSTPGDTEEQEPPAGDEDLMGEIDEAPDTTPETEFERYDPIHRLYSDDVPDSPKMDEQTTSAVEQVREELTSPSRRPTRTRRPTKKGRSK